MPPSTRPTRRWLSSSFTEAGYWEEGFTVSIYSDQTHEGFTGLTLKDSIEA